MNTPTQRMCGGSALLESVLGIALLALFVIILAGSVTYLEQSALRAKQHAQALLRAKEGLEAVRSIRDADFLKLTDGTHGLATEGGHFVFSGMSDESDGNSRSVTLVHNDASTTKVTSDVAWGKIGQESHIILETYLTDWRSPK